MSRAAAPGTARPRARLHARALLAMAFVILLGGMRANAADPSKPPSCAGDANAPELKDARAALEHNPEDLPTRFKFSDALIEQGCFPEAVHVLESAEEGHAHSAELQIRLRNAKSMLNEEHYFEGLANAEESAKLQHNLLRCGQLGDLDACDAALTAKPDDRDILVAKADALLQAGRPADALPLYRRAAELSPGSETLRNKIATAETQRRSLVARCQNDSGNAALEACRHALLRGTEDELAIAHRQAALEHGTGGTLASTQQGQITPLHAADQPAAAREPRKRKSPPQEYSNQATAGSSN
jgi:tetratricopeptide (TPR) repeat protein